jgi:hypothetical protein
LEVLSVDIECVLDLIKPRPSFWFRVWLFFFLLINRKEGKRLFETLIEKINEYNRNSVEMIRKVDAFAKEAHEKCERAMAENQKGITGLGDG